jgi:glycine hydroxymethyltransferase
MSLGRSPLHVLDVDAQTAALIAAEERRQREKIILIPSESLTPLPVREALGSAFTSVYAEGYPRKAMMRQTQDELADIDVQLASYRRYADRRFYKGTEMADLVESLAARRAAECFATAEYPADRIFANVQPLSGAAANLAVYDAFVKPGETVMGMALTEGGHLTHGSEFNVTGRRYRIVSYAIDRDTGKLDYEKILALALEHRPRMIIGGFTSYPWQPDWARFREIADAVGAILLADVAHTAGLIVGKAYPNPIGHAHVVSFTTHKTLCGGRGAVILSTDPQIASRIDTAVFPGQQGGPHVNKFAALAVTLKLAQEPAFAALQRRIVENAQHLARALAENGLTMAYGGTDTHLLLVDLREIKTNTGFVMMGEIASRILDLAGLVCNKNTLPGDRSAADAHGIRLGTPWATQRGMGKVEMETIGRIVAEVLLSIRPFSYQGLRGELSRGKLPLKVLDRAKQEVREIVAHIEPRVGGRTEEERRRAGASQWTVLRVRSGRAGALLQEATTSDIRQLAASTSCSTYLLDEQGCAVSSAIVGCLGRDDYVVLVPPDRARDVHSWLEGLAEGYTLFDSRDLFRKIQGPALIEETDESALPQAVRTWLTLPVEESVVGQSVTRIAAENPRRFALDKPYFVGQQFLDLQGGRAAPPAFSWTEEGQRNPRTTALHESHVALGARLVPFAGWEMPVWYTSALEEHRAVRRAAGLFDLGHMGVFQVEGERATEFLDAVTSNYEGWLEDGQSHYAYLLGPDGKAIDDIWVYRRAWNRYLVVVNAANEQKDWAWLAGVNEGRYAVDSDHPTCRLAPGVVLRDLKRERGVMDIALQGPKSCTVLKEILGPGERRIVAALERTEFVEVTADGHQLLVARTGYTGEPLGYEIYSAAADALWLWNRLLDLGRPLGLLPCGLASRDSTRTEAGLPLYGHELAGPHDINPFEAGFGPYIKLHKAFFVGRAACIDYYLEQKREIVRFEVEAGSRPVREGALILDRNGTVLGHVTSCVSLGEAQIGLALLERRGLDADTPVLLVPAPRPDSSPQTADVGARLPVASPGRIVSRFLARDLAPESEAE